MMTQHISPEITFVKIKNFEALTSCLNLATRLVYMSLLWFLNSREYLVPLTTIATFTTNSTRDNVSIGYMDGHTIDAPLNHGHALGIVMILSDHRR